MECPPGVDGGHAPAGRRRRRHQFPVV